MLTFNLTYFIHKCVCIGAAGSEDVVEAQTWPEVQVADGSRRHCMVWEGLWNLGCLFTELMKGLQAAGHVQARGRQAADIAEGWGPPSP